MAQLALPAFSRLVRGTGCHPRRSKSNHKTGHFAANVAFCRLIFLQLPSSQLDMAEACGSRTQTFNSQLTANDDVAAFAKSQLESIGVSRPPHMSGFGRSWTRRLSSVANLDAELLPEACRSAHSLRGVQARELVSVRSQLYRLYPA